MKGYYVLRSEVLRSGKVVQVRAELATIANRYDMRATFGLAARHSSEGGLNSFP
jgi:hypothetical protein